MFNASVEAKWIPPEATTARFEIVWMNEATSLKFQPPPVQTIPVLPPVPKNAKSNEDDTKAPKPKPLD